MPPCIPLIGQHQQHNSQDQFPMSVTHGSTCCAPQIPHWGVESKQTTPKLQLISFPTDREQTRRNDAMLTVIRCSLVAGSLVGHEFLASRGLPGTVSTQAVTKGAITPPPRASSPGNLEFDLPSAPPRLFRVVHVMETQFGSSMQPQISTKPRV